MNYHRNFVQGFAGISACLYSLTKKDHNTEKDVPYEWTSKRQNAFEKLKLAVLLSPVMNYPMKKDKYILDCDTTDFSVGAALSQVQDGEERVIDFGSFTLTPKKYCTTRKELLSVISFTRT